MAEDHDEVIIDFVGKDNVSAPADRAANSIDKVGKQADRSGKQLDEFGNSTDEAGKKQTEFEKKVGETEKALKAQEKALAASKLELTGYKKQIADGTKTNDELKSSINECTKRIDRQGQAVTRTKALLVGLTSSTEDAKKANDAYNSSLRDTENQVKRTDSWLKRLFNRLRSPFGGGNNSNGGFLRNLMGGFGGWMGPKVLGFLKGFVLIGGKFGAMAFGAAFLGKAIYGLGAAGVAAVNGLTPLSGLLIAYPGIFAAFMQAFGVFKIATGGMGKLIGTLADPAATAAQIAKASQGMSKSQINFAKEMVKSKGAWTAIKSVVGKNFYKGLVGPFHDLVHNYLPVMKKYLGDEATILNKLLKDGLAWLNLPSSKMMLSQIMHTNAREADNFGHSLGNLTVILLHLLNDAGPMLRRMSHDFKDFTGSLKGDVITNGGGITGFFNRSYTDFKHIKSSLMDYVVGIKDIIDYSDSLTKFIGKGAKGIGQDFRDFTESPEGEKKIRAWFKSMRPVVKEIVLWVRDIGIQLNGAVLSNGNFLKASRELRTKVLPVIGDVFNQFTEAVVPTIEKLHKSGVMGGLMRAVTDIAHFLNKVADLAMKLPDPGKKLVAWATTIVAMKSILNNVTGGAIGKVQDAATNAIKNRLLGPDVQKVFVVNMPPGGIGGGGGVPGEGGPGKKPFLATPLGAATASTTIAAISGYLTNKGMNVINQGMGRSAAQGAGMTAMNAGTGTAGFGGSYVADKLAAAQGSPSPAMLDSAIKAQDPSGTLTMGAKSAAAFQAALEKLWQEGKKAQALDAFKKAADGLGFSIGALARTTPEFTHWVNSGFDGFVSKRDGLKAMNTLMYGTGKYASGLGQAMNPVNDRLVSFDKHLNVVDGGLRQTKGSIDGARKAADSFNHPYTPKISVFGVPEAIANIKNVKTELDSVQSRSVDLAINVKTNAFGLKAQQIMGLSGLYTGGNTEAGRMYVAGELGPEAFISRAGKMSVVGLNGPELIKPGAGAVINHEATKDPYKGAANLTPAWALQKYREAVSGDSGASERGATSVLDRPGDNVTVNMPITIQGGTSMSEQELIRAAKKAAAAAAQELRERQ